jgi:hypothetical protein
LALQMMQHLSMIALGVKQRRPGSKIIPCARPQVANTCHDCVFMSRGIDSYLCVSVQHSAPENLETPAGLRTFALLERCIQIKRYFYFDPDVLTLSWNEWCSTRRHLLPWISMVSFVNNPCLLNTRPLELVGIVFRDHNGMNPRPLYECRICHCLRKFELEARQA